MRLEGGVIFTVPFSNKQILQTSSLEHWLLLIMLLAHNSCNLKRLLWWRRWQKVPLYIRISVCGGRLCLLGLCLCLLRPGLGQGEGLRVPPWIPPGPWLLLLL
jgi:hypothetical protein